MFLSRSDITVQVERFLARLPSSLVRDVARPMPERLRDGLGIHVRKFSAPQWSSVRGPGAITGLRGFVLWFDFHALPAGDDGDITGPVYFVERDKTLWRLDATIRGDVLEVDGKTSTAAALVEECGDDRYGPLSWGHGIMLMQFGPAAKSARERAARLERLTKYVEDAHRLDAETWQEYEYVVEWEGESPIPTRFRDIRRHAARGTYLVREWDAGCDPHRIQEFKELEQALEAANYDGVCGYLRRRAGGGAR